MTILSASSVRTLAFIEMNHSRPPDLMSSSYVRLPFAWITGPRKRTQLLGVRSPWSRLKNSMEYISKCDQNWMRRGEKKSILYGTSAACRMIPFPARKTKVIPIYHSGKSIEKKLFFSIVLDNSRVSNIVFYVGLG